MTSMPSRRSRLRAPAVTRPTILGVRFRLYGRSAPHSGLTALGYRSRPEDRGRHEQEVQVRFVAVAAGLPVVATVIWAVVRSPLARVVVAAPRQDRWHTRPTPLLGGVGIFAGFLAGIGACLAAGAAPATKELGAIVAGCAILFLA